MPRSKIARARAHKTSARAPRITYGRQATAAPRARLPLSQLQYASMGVRAQTVSR